MRVLLVEDDTMLGSAVRQAIHDLRRKLGADRILNVLGPGWMVERPGEGGR